MAPVINNWYAAGGKLDAIRDTCEAFVRGDQPEKINHLTVSEIKELQATAAAIVMFCVASIEKRDAPLEHRKVDTYSYAKTYARNLAHTLLNRDDIRESDQRMLEAWLKNEANLPQIHLSYV